MKQADTRWQYSDSSEAYTLTCLIVLYCINDNKRTLQRLGHVSRHANVSSRSRLEIWTSRLGLVSAGEAKRLCLVSVSAIHVSCPSLRTGEEKYIARTTPHTTTVSRPFFWDHPGEPVPEENFWTLWCKGRLTEADTQTIQLGATPSRLTSAHLHHPPFFTGRMPFLLPNQQCQSTEGKKEIARKKVSNVCICYAGQPQSLKSLSLAGTLQLDSNSMSNQQRECIECSKPTKYQRNVEPVVSLIQSHGHSHI